jgi:hypothetical protein
MVMNANEVSSIEKNAFGKHVQYTGVNSSNLVAFNTQAAEVRIITRTSTSNPTDTGVQM